MTKVIFFKINKMKKMLTIGKRSVMVAALCLCALGAMAQEKLALTLELQEYYILMPENLSFFLLVLL